MKRKLYVPTLPKKLDKLQKEEVTEFYISAKNNVDLRYFNEDGKYYYVESIGSLTGPRRMINEAEFKKKLKKHEGRVISKTRYYIPLNNTRRASLDVYGEDLSGLNILEVDIRANDNFRKPKWAGGDLKNSYFGIYSLTNRPVSEIFNQVDDNLKVR